MQKKKKKRADRTEVGAYSSKGKVERSQTARNLETTTESLLLKQSITAPRSGVH